MALPHGTITPQRGASEIAAEIALLSTKLHVIVKYSTDLRTASPPTVSNVSRGRSLVRRSA